jgi:uncharacterized peroxidase-related enzyme
MSRFNIPSREDANANVDTHSTLDVVGKRLGFIPNLHRLMSISRNAFAGWAALQDALKQTLDARTREGMALAVSEVNGCDYCTTAHSYVATTFTKSSPDELALNRKGRSSDPKRAVAIGFAKSLVEKRGKVTDEDLDAVRAAGYTDQQILEMVALSVQFLFTNFINNVAKTHIDIPDAAAVKASTASSQV